MKEYLEELLNPKDGTNWKPKRETSYKGVQEEHIKEEEVKRIIIVNKKRRQDTKKITLKCKKVLD